MRQGRRSWYIDFMGSIRIAATQQHAAAQNRNKQTSAKDLQHGQQPQQLRQPANEQESAKRNRTTQAHLHQLIQQVQFQERQV